ncbi:polynucleotide adenylyltransferase PcnB [soil metagenome]
MIRKFIARLLGRPLPDSSSDSSTGPIASTASQREAARRADQPRVHDGAKLGIDPELIPGYATRVTKTLQDAGFKAFIVGGAVRDLLVGRRPKDFDVATDATPEQVNATFRRSRIIGRRFQIVHVGFGEQTVEVSTFRALADTSAPPAASETAAADAPTEDDPGVQQAEQHARGGADLKSGSRRERRGQPVAQTRSVDESGRLLRDNVFGPQHEDAARRDFTINAMYYDPSSRTVLDYHGGVEDTKARRLRIIGDATTRYREDPVRMLRAVRFAAKLDFTIDASTAAPIATCADLIAGVPMARLFDEMLKLLFCGHARAAIEQLRAQGLHSGLLPLLDTVLDTPDGERFINAALASTDARIAADKPASPGFLFAALLWPSVRRLWEQRQAQDMAALPALFAAADEVLATQMENLQIQRRFVSDMKEIWALQPRFDKRLGRAPFRLLEQPRFRAAYDFLLLRAEAGEADAALAEWWTEFSQSEGADRETLVERAAETDTASDAPRKRRRRKRKPNGDGSANDGPEPDAAPTSA